MKLRKPCVEHGVHYDPYRGSGYEKDGRWVTTPTLINCPGGVFLPDDTLIIEDVQRATDALEFILRTKGGFLYPSQIFDALREAE